MQSINTKEYTLEESGVISDVFSQAITGELIGMSNFASLAQTIDDPYEKMEAVEHANSERMHAEGFITFAKRANLQININLESPYWGRVRKVFLSHASQQDFISCLIIQEIMLESFAVSMYTDVGQALRGAAGKLFIDTAEEEKEHLRHASHFLQAAYKRDPAAFIIQFEKLHFECMGILAEFTATTDLRGHCGVCHGDCMKDSLHHIGLDVNTMRGNALALYAEAVNDIGVPGEKSIVWIAQLPA
jgi:hypothetical protein